MKTTIKLAAIGACALAVSSTAAFAGYRLSTLPAGFTTGLALGAPLPEGVYDISIASYGSRNEARMRNVAYALPVWLIWSTPVADRRWPHHARHHLPAWRTFGLTAVPGADSWLNTLVDAGIAWNLGGGWNVGLHAGVWLPSTQTIPTALGRDDAVPGHRHRSATWLTAGT